MIQYPNTLGIVLGVSIGTTAVIVGIPLLFLRRENTPSRIGIAFAALGSGIAMTLIPLVMGTHSGHGMLVSAFSGSRGTALQVAFFVFGAMLLAVEAVVRLFRFFRGRANAND